MAWEERPSGRRFYYRKVWTEGTCRSEYIGAGAVANLIAQHDEVERQQQAAEREAWRRKAEEQAAIDQQIDELSAQVQDLVTAVLLATGHRQHKRSEWRRRRGIERDN